MSGGGKGQEEEDVLRDRPRFGAQYWVSSPSISKNYSFASCRLPKMSDLFSRIATFETNTNSTAEESC